MENANPVLAHKTHKAFLRNPRSRVALAYKAHGMVLLVVFRATKRYREHHHIPPTKKNEVKILCVLCVCRHIVCSLVSNVRSKNEGFIFSLDSVPSGPNAHVKDLVRNNNNKNADQKWTNTLEKFNKCNFYFLFIL